MIYHVLVEKSEEQQKFIFGQNMEDRVVNVVCTSLKIDRYNYMF